jgi:hypothetical protein
MYNDNLVIHCINQFYIVKIKFILYKSNLYCIIYKKFEKYETII